MIPRVRSNWLANTLEKDPAISLPPQIECILIKENLERNKQKKDMNLSNAIFENTPETVLLARLLRRQNDSASGVLRNGGAVDDPGGVHNRVGFQ